MTSGLYPIKNYRIHSSHLIYRHPPSSPFKGTLPEVKAEARRVLGGLGTGWTVKAVTDGETIYCEWAR